MDAGQGPADAHVDASFSGDSGLGLDATVPAVDASEESFELSFLSPIEGQSFVRDQPSGDRLIALVGLRLAGRNVQRVEIWIDGRLAASGNFGDMLSAELSTDGTHRFLAQGYSAAGIVVAGAEVSVRVTAPPDTSCRGQLSTFGVGWSNTSSSPGIDDPIMVDGIIGGVAYHSPGRAPARMLVDCPLALRLYRLSEILVERGIDEVVHLGIYNYRCIGGGDPSSGCTPSQHAFAQAIDLHSFGLAASDTVYSVESDWVITEREDPCPIASTTAADRALKELACDMWSEAIFQIVLTPNYNGDHRDHFHVDMKEGSMYLGSFVGGIDPVLGHGDF